MKRRLLILLVLIVLSLLFTLMPVAANEDIYVGGGEWCEYQGDGLWFCLEDGPTYLELKDYYSTTA